MNMRSDPAGSPNREPQEKKKMGGTCGGLAYGVGDTQHGVVLVRVSRVDSKEQSADE
jgi:hypothetical protein